MRTRSIILLTLLLLAAVAVCVAAPMTKLQIVVKTKAGRPVDQASVIVRWHANKKNPAARYGRAVRTTYEMRTDQDGQAKVPSIPQGSILIQVNAKGYQTFGQLFEINEEEKSIEIKLNPPQQQYTAH